MAADEDDLLPPLLFDASTLHQRRNILGLSTIPPTVRTFTLHGIIVDEISMPPIEILLQQWAWEDFLRSIDRSLRTNISPDQSTVAVTPAQRWRSNNDWLFSSSPHALKYQAPPQFAALSIKQFRQLCKIRQCMVSLVTKYQCLHLKYFCSKGLGKYQAPPQFAALTVKNMWRRMKMGSKDQQNHFFIWTKEHAQQHILFSVFSCTIIILFSCTTTRIILFINKIKKLFVYWWQTSTFHITKEAVARVVEEQLYFATKLYMKNLWPPAAQPRRQNNIICIYRAKHTTAHQKYYSFSSSQSSHYQWWTPKKNT